MKTSASRKVLAFPTQEHKDAILALFPDAKPSGDGRYHFRCSGHDDNNPSAQVGYSADGKPLVICHAGCSNDDIAKGVGLRDAAALYAALRRKPTRFRLHAPTQPTISDADLRKYPTDRYEYRDERGKLMYAVQRYEHRGEKTFRPFKADGTPGLKNVRRVVYRLRTLHQKRPKHVWWVEGEKCVRRLKKLGLRATTSVGGANGYKETFNYAQQLANAGVEAVTVLPDNNEPGLAYAHQVAQDLQQHGLKVKLVPLPGLTDPKDDVVEWLAAGNTKDDLRELRRAAAEYSPAQAANVRCLADVEAETVRWLWPPYIPLGKVTLIEGDPGIGKSWLALVISAAVARGHGLPGMLRGKPRKVLLLTAEDGLGDTVRPRLDHIRADMTRIFALESPLVFDEAGCTQLEAVIERLKPALVIVDPFVAYLGAGVDMHRANETRAVMARLSDIAHQHQCAIVLIRHLTKSGKDKSIYRGLGSIDLTAACRSVLLVGVDPEDEGCAALVHIKSNLAKKGPSQGYTVEDGQFQWTGESDLTATRLLAVERDTRNAMDDATDFLKKYIGNKAVDVRELKNAAQGEGVSWRTVERAKKKLVVLTEPVRNKKTNKVERWTWRLPRP